jgi:uncharacterized membrane protein
MIKREWINILAIVLFFALALYCQQNYEPDSQGKVVTSYDAAGLPATSTSAFIAIWLLPIIALVLYALTILIADMSVYKIHLERFFDKFFSFKLTMIFMIFAIYISRVLVYFNKRDMEVAGLKDISVESFILVGTVATGFFYLAYMMHHLKGNHFAPWIKGRNKMWEETHHVGTWLFLICGIVILLSLIIPKLFIFFIAVPLFSVIIMIVLYSYIIFKKEHHMN